MSVNYPNVDVAIIGAGPAGLAAAIELKRSGIAQVWVFEREAHAGGVPRHCGHPPFGFWEYGRLYSGPAYAARHVNEALKAGVKILTQHSVTYLGAQGALEGVSPEGAFRLGARRVLLATGAREMPRSARLVGGDRPVGVLNTGALQSYLYLEKIKPFSRPLIIGTELVSLSSILSCRKHGITPVAVLEENDRPTARWPFSLFPRLCGIPLHLGATLVSINGVGRVESATVRLRSGQHTEIACDGVLLTGHFTPESSLARTSNLAIDPGSGGPSIDQYGRCSDPAYFAAGNLLRPIETAGWSHREGRRIAKWLLKDLHAELPPPTHDVAIDCLGPIKLCVPQRLNLQSRGLKHLQLRVKHPVSGLLQIKADGRVIWSKPVHCLPERRLLIPIQALHQGVAAKKLEVDVVGR